MQLLATSGQPLPATVIRGNYEIVDSVPEQTVTLPPHAQGRFYFMYTDTLDGGFRAACPKATAVEMSPPGAYNHLSVTAVDFAPCEGRVWVSSVTSSEAFPLIVGWP